MEALLAGGFGYTGVFGDSFAINLFEVRFDVGTC